MKVGLVDEIGGLWTAIEVMNELFEKTNDKPTTSQEKQTKSLWNRNNKASNLPSSMKKSKYPIELLQSESRSTIALKNIKLPEEFFSVYNKENNLLSLQSYHQSQDSYKTLENMFSSFLSDNCYAMESSFLIKQKLPILKSLIFFRLISLCSETSELFPMQQ
jgi:hypothetical protein